MTLPSEPWKMRLSEWIESGDGVRAVERGPLREGEIVVYSEDFLRSIRCTRSATSSLEVGGDVALSDISGTILSLRKAGSLWFARVEWDDQTTSTAAVRNLSRRYPPPSIRQAHWFAVKTALEQGEPVPDRVLLDWPDLSAQFRGVVHPDLERPVDRYGSIRWYRSMITTHRADDSAQELWKEGLYNLVSFAWELIPPQYSPFRRPMEEYL